MLFVFLFKQKTAYELRISDWSSDVCSSDLGGGQGRPGRIEQGAAYAGGNDKHDKQQVLEGCRERMRLHVGHDSSRNCVGGIGGQSAAIFRLGGERRPAIGRTKSILHQEAVGGLLE